MNDIKKGYMVSLVTTSDSGAVLSCQQVFAHDQGMARAELVGLQMNADPNAQMVGTNQTTVSGKYVSMHPDAPTKFYYGTYCDCSVRVDELADLYRAFEVEVEVTRKWTITVEIDEAEDEEQAYDKAEERVTDGDEDWRLDAPDDEYVEHLNTEEA